MHINGYWNTRNWYFLRHFYCGSLFFKIEFFTDQWRIPKWEGYNSVLILVSCSGRIVMKKRAGANMSAPVPLLISRDNIVWKNIFTPFIQNHVNRILGLAKIVPCLYIESKSCEIQSVIWDEICTIVCLILSDQDCIFFSIFRKYIKKSQHYKAKGNSINNESRKARFLKQKWKKSTSLVGKKVGFGPIFLSDDFCFVGTISPCENWD